MVKVVSGETYPIQKYELKPNSAFEYEDTPTLTFYGKPAGRLEKKSYRIQQGIAGSDSSIYLMCSNLPEDIKDGDKVKFNGTMWTVQSVGYYFDNSLIVNAKLFPPEYIINQCVKGITLS